MHVMYVCMYVCMYGIYVSSVFLLLSLLLFWLFVPVVVAIVVFSTPGGERVSCTIALFLFGPIMAHDRRCSPVFVAIRHYHCFPLVFAFHLLLLLLLPLTMVGFVKRSEVFWAATSAFPTTHFVRSGLFVVVVVVIVVVFLVVVALL